MLGCSSCAMSCASRTNRSASEGSGERSRSRTLIATSRPTDATRQRNTAANPPSPSSGPTVNSSPTARWRRSCRTAMSMADGKRRNARRAALGIVALGVVWLLAVWPPPVWWRAHTPRCTAMMRLRSDCLTASRSTRYVSLQEVAPVLQRMVVIGEDSRFHTHSGVDVDEIRDAAGVPPGAGVWATARALWLHRDRVRGASTITQQLAKNLYLSPSRSALRKLKEAVTAVRLELALPKDRILELYLNTAEWGPGIWGVEAASETYFGVPASRLTAEPAAALAATLPFPRSSNPVFQPSRMAARRELILARYYGADVIVPPVLEELDTLTLTPIPPITAPLLPPVIDSLLNDTILDTLRLAQVGRLHREAHRAAGKGKPDAVRLVARHDAHAP